MEKVEITGGDVWAALGRLEERARNGEEKALGLIRQFLDAHPELWDQLGEVGRLVERGWLERICGGKVVAFEAMVRQVARDRRELLGESPTALDRLLVDGVVAAKLEVQHGQLMLQGSAGGLPVTAQRLRGADSGHRRLQQAVKLLNEVRGKLTPAERVSVAPAGPLDVSAPEPEPPLKRGRKSAAATKSGTAGPAARPRLRIYEGGRESA